MDDEIYGEDLGVEVLDGGATPALVVIDASRPGSAGAIVVSLGHGVTLSVDYAEPQQLVEIQIESQDPNTTAQVTGFPAETVELLQELLGLPSVIEIENMFTTRSVGRTVVRGEGGLVPRSKKDSRKNYPALQLGLAAHLVDIANCPEELLGVRFVAAFEALRQIRRTDTKHVKEAFDQIVTASIDAIRLADSYAISGLDDLEADLQELLAVDSGLAQDSANVIDAGRDLIPTRLVELQQRVLAILRNRKNQESVQHHEQAVDRLEDPNIVPVENPPTVTEKSPGRLLTKWLHRPTGESLRVLDRKDQTVLAVAPIHREDSCWVAEAVFPMDLTLNGILVGSSDAPFPFGESSVLDRVVAAIRLGRKAIARFNYRNGDRAEIEAAWMNCAKAWEDLGDTQRAQQARRYAKGWPINRTRLLADQVREALEGT